MAFMTELLASSLLLLALSDTAHSQAQSCGQVMFVWDLIRCPAPSNSMTRGVCNTMESMAPECVSGTTKQTLTRSGTRKQTPSVSVVIERPTPRAAPRTTQTPATTTVASVLGRPEGRAGTGTGAGVGVGVGVGDGGSGPTTQRQATAAPTAPPAPVATTAAAGPTSPRPQQVAVDASDFHSGNQNGGAATTAPSGGSQPETPTEAKISGVGATAQERQASPAPSKQSPGGPRGTTAPSPGSTASPASASPGTGTSASVQPSAPAGAGTSGAETPGSRSGSPSAPAGAGTGAAGTGTGAAGAEALGTSGDSAGATAAGPTAGSGGAGEAGTTGAAVASTAAAATTGAPTPHEGGSVEAASHAPTTRTQADPTASAGAELSEAQAGDDVTTSEPAVTSAVEEAQAQAEAWETEVTTVGTGEEDGGEATDEASPVSG